jgi:hypothetical protein
MVKKEMIKVKALVSYFEIFVLIMATISYSCLIYKADNVNNVGNVVENKDVRKISLFKIILNYFINQLKKPLIGSVSAANSFLQCCENAKDGGVCQQYKAD